MLKKRGLALWITFVMLFSCFPVQAFAAGVSITNVKATDISKTDATFTAVLNNPTGIQPSEVGIYFGESNNNMRPAAKDTYVYNQATLDFWYNANSDMGIYLEPATTYWYRFYAIINGETVWGPFKSMQTDGEVKLQASFGDETVTDKTETDGTFCGVLYNPTGIQPSEVGCYIGTNSSNMKLLGRDTYVYNQAELDIWYNANDEGMTLEPGTKYYFQFYAIIGGEKVEGKKRSITTKEAPKVEEHVHKWKTTVNEEHPHKSVHTCDCGAKETVRNSNYVSDCEICNPVAEEHIHNWKTTVSDQHPHKSVQSCDCGAKETVRSSNYMSDCEICNPQEEEYEDVVWEDEYVDESEYWGWDEYESDYSEYEDSYADEYYADGYEDSYSDDYYADEYDYGFTEDFYEDTTAYLDDSYFYKSATISVGIGQNYVRKQGTIIYMDAPAYTNVAGYTMVPLRAIAECLDGTDVEWDNGAKTAIVYRYNGDVIKMSTALNFIQVNESGFWGKTKPEIKNGRIFIPMRDLATAFGLSSDAIEWDPNTKTATFYF